MNNNNNNFQIPAPPVNNIITSSSSSRISVTSTSKNRQTNKITFSSDTTDPKSSGKYLPPARLPRSDNNDNNNNDPTSLSSTSSSQEDVGTLKHFSYSCPGLTGPDAGGNTTHVEALPFAFLFGLPPEEEQELKERIQKQQEEQNSIHNNSASNSGGGGNGAGWKSKRSQQDLVEASKRQIIIPLYQRTYTWVGETQGVKWFADCTKSFGSYYQYDSSSNSMKVISEKDRAILRHGTGKMVMKKFHEEGNVNNTNSSPSSISQTPWICIDGQQRATTMSLLFGAIYTVGVCDVLNAATENNIPVHHQFQKSEETEENFLQAKEYFLKLLHQMLFVDVDAAKNWVREKSKQGKRNEDAADVNNSEQQDPETEIWFREGVRIPGARLIPSHVDRSPFFELMTRQFIKNELSTVKNSNDVSTINSDFSKSCKQTLQGKMMLDVFIPRVRRFLFSSPEMLSSKTQCLQKLSLLVKHLLHGVGLIIVELLSKETRIAQVFLWMQEKSLFGMGALLWNPAPGIHFRATDLVRNLLMAPFMKLNLERQEEIHKRLWLLPVEVPTRKFLLSTTRTRSSTNSTKNDENQQKKSSLTVDDLTLMLVQELEQEQLKTTTVSSTLTNNEEETATTIKPQKLFQSKFHATVDKMNAFSATRNSQLPKDDPYAQPEKDTTGMNTYARFYSLFEYQLQKTWKNEKQKQMNENNNTKNNNDDDDDVNQQSSRTIEEVEEECCEYFLKRFARVTGKFIIESSKDDDDDYDDES